MGPIGVRVAKMRQNGSKMVEKSIFQIPSKIRLRWLDIGFSASRHPKKSILTTLHPLVLPQKAVYHPLWGAHMVKMGQKWVKNGQKCPEMHFHQ